MINSPSKCRGAALLLVLMITAAMASIMMFMSEKGNNAARMANLIKAHGRAKLAVDTQEAELINELMTTPLAILGPGGSYNGVRAESPVVTNFIGEEIKIGELSINIQDVSGLVSILPLNKLGFEQLLRHHGVADDELAGLLDRLDDWQDADNLRRLEGAERGDYLQPYLPTNTILQTLEELRYILEDDVLYEQLKPHLAIYSEPYIVRQFTPKTLYSAFGFEGQTEGTEAIEGAGVPLPSGRFLIQISHQGNIRYSKKFVFARGPGLRPYYINNKEIVN